MTTMPFMNWSTACSICIHVRTLEAQKQLTCTHPLLFAAAAGNNAHVDAFCGRRSPLDD